MQQDPLVEHLAQIGYLDQEYLGLMSLMENRTLPRDLPVDSELKQVEGCLQELRVVETLHLCHSAPGSMIPNPKGRVYWPSMRQQIHELYNSCVECSHNKISKTRPPNECSQSDLFENFFPNSFLQADFMEFGGQDYMTMVDTLTGYGRVFITKGKTTEEALKVVRQWTALYGRCLEIRLDSGPAFRSSFTAGLKGMGIKLNHSSAYSPQSNSHAERFVRSSKNILQKNQKLNQLQSDEMMLSVNSQVQPEGQCSAVDRFLGRSVISYIPNSFNNTFVWQEAIRKRAEVCERRVRRPA